MHAALVLMDAKVVTMAEHPHSPLAEAVAIVDGRIAAVGSNADMAALIGPHTRTMSLRGKTVLPGFIDSHVHFTQTGLGSLGPHLYNVDCANRALEVIAEALCNLPPGKPLLVHGCSIGDLDRPLTLAELDRIGGTVPILVGDVGAHSCLVNSAAMALLQLAADLPGIERDAKGNRTGLLTGQANTQARYRYYNHAVDDETRVAALHRAACLAVEVGITTVHALEGGSDNGRGWLPERDAEILLREQEQLPVRTVLYFQSTDVHKALQWGLPRIGGCVWVDGSYGEHTAALFEPYCNCRSSKGRLYFSYAELNAFVGEAHRAGLQISMHAIGDAAIEQLLNAYEDALTQHPRRDHRHRIEHFSLPTAAQIERATRLGVAVGMQPNFAVMSDPATTPAETGGLIDYLGPERYARRHPYRTIVDSGLLVAGGSDADPKPMGPLIGIQAVVNHPDAQRRLTVQEALALYTVNGARIAFEEGCKGSIEPGKLADLVVLGDDPFSVEPRHLAQIVVEKTIVRGELVYERG